MLTQAETTTLEAYADTIIPGRRRHLRDRAISGVSASAGAVEAGALDVLANAATGIEDSTAEMARLLDAAALDFAAEKALVVSDDGTAFADLNYPDRRTLVTRLIGRESPLRDFWFLLALFSYMAYDSAPHRDTATAIKDGHAGLAAMGFSRPSADGVWRFERPGYGRSLARLHPDTDGNGNLP